MRRILPPQQLMSLQKASIMSATKITFLPPQRELLIIEWPHLRHDMDERIPVPSFSEVSPSTMKFRSEFILSGHDRILGKVAIKCNNKHLWIPVLFDTGAPQVYLSAETFNKFEIDTKEIPHASIEIGEWSGIAVLSEGESVDKSPLKDVNIIGMQFLKKDAVNVFQSHFDRITGSSVTELPKNVDDFLRNLFPVKNEETKFVQIIVLNSFKNISRERIKDIVLSHNEVRDLLEESKKNLLSSLLQDNDGKSWHLVNNINITSLSIEITGSLRQI